MRVLVCGGRDFRDFRWLERYLDDFDSGSPIEILGHGGCGERDRDGRPTKGADLLAGLWANKRGIPCVGMDAAWLGLGRKAGPIRNGWLHQFFTWDKCIAFPGGKGTADMVRKALAAGVDVIEV